MEKLIALRDINDAIKAGDHFEAPDRILVAMGLATDDASIESGSEPALNSPQWTMQRRRRRAQVAE